MEDTNGEGTSLVPAGINELSLVRAEQSLEQRVGEKAIEQLRAELGITRPELKNLFFLPRYFDVFYGLKATLEEIGASVTGEACERHLAEIVTQYIERVAKLRQRNGIGAIVLGKNAHYHLGKEELNTLRVKELSYEARLEQLRRVIEIKCACGIAAYPSAIAYPSDYHRPYKITTSSIQQQLEGLVKEASSFVKNFSLVPVSDSVQQEAWKAIIPVVVKTSILWGAYSQENAIPFESSGASSSQSRTESPMPQYTLLEPQYGAVLADKFLMLIESFNGDLGQLAARVAPFVKKEGELPPDLQIQLALFNYLLRGLYGENGATLSGSYVTCLNTALNGISSHLKSIFSFIGEFKLKEFTILEVNSIIRNAGFKVESHYDGRATYYSIATKPLNK